MARSRRVSGFLSKATWQMRSNGSRFLPNSSAIGSRGRPLRFQFLDDRLLAARRVSGNVFLTAAASEGDPNRLVLRFSVDEKYVTDIYTGRLNFFRRPIKAARQAKNHVGGGCELLD